MKPDIRITKFADGVGTALVIHETGEKFSDRFNLGDATARHKFAEQAALNGEASQIEERLLHAFADYQLNQAADDLHDDDEKVSQAEKIVRIAQERYTFGRTPDDEAFAVKVGGANVAIPFRSGKKKLFAELSKAYRELHQGVPNSAALNDALGVLLADALESEPTDVALRLAQRGDRIIVDLGDRSGRSVIIQDGTWEIAEESPVLFHRTKLTAPLPLPERGGSMDELRELLNVTDDSWPLLLGYLVAAFIPDIDHPVLMLGGQQGSGKSTAGEYIVRTFDNTTAPRRSQPKNEDNWAIQAIGSWGVLLDNVSNIPQWLSDTLCKAVTGDAHVRRSLFTDGDLFVMKFRRVIAITSIDAGALQGDLGSRLLFVELERIDEANRRRETDLAARFNAAHPRILGALLDIVAKVTERLATTDVPPSDRLADFSCVLAAMDSVLGTDALQRYIDQRGHIADTVVEDDAVIAAVRDFAIEQCQWSGKSRELLKAITPEKPPRGWPSARGLAGKLRRAQPALRALGVDVAIPKKNDRTRTYRLEANSLENNRPYRPNRPQSSIPAQDGGFGQGGCSGGRAVDGATHRTQPPTENGDSESEIDILGGMGGMGGRIPNGWDGTPGSSAGAPTPRQLEIIEAEESKLATDSDYSF